MWEFPKSGARNMDPKERDLSYAGPKMGAPIYQNPQTEKALAHVFAGSSAGKAFKRSRRGPQHATSHISRDKPLQPRQGEPTQTNNG